MGPTATFVESCHNFRQMKGNTVCNKPCKVTMQADGKLDQFAQYETELQLQLYFIENKYIVYSIYRCGRVEYIIEMFVLCSGIYH